MKAPYQAHPWDDLWRTIGVDHQVRDAFWDERNVLPELAAVDIPVYVGCDLDNVPHLPGTFSTWRALAGNPEARMALLPSGGTTWPWDSLHVEALAWFDRHLKGRDTGIDEGPPIRFWLPGADEWRTASEWPPESEFREFGLSADGILTEEEPTAGTRDYICLGTGLRRAKRAARSDPPTALYWTSEPLPDDLDVAGDIELRLTATTTAPDTAWIVALKDVAPDGSVTNVTGGWQRATLREIDNAASRTGAPVVPSRGPQLVPIGEPVEYRIPLVPNAKRFVAGHRIQLMLTSDDQPKATPVFLDYRHVPVGNNTRNTISSQSRLLLPVLS